MKKNILSSTIIVALSLHTESLFASGYALLDYSARDMATGLAGSASSADDATAVYSNPAALVDIHSNMVSAGFSYIEPHTAIDNASGTYSGTNKGDMVAPAWVPFIYGASPLAQNWSVGLGIFVPYGLSTEYEDSFQGRYFGVTSSVRVLTVQPVLSWKIADNFSLGFGPNWNAVSGDLSQAIINPVSPGTNDWRAKVKGDASAWGYTVGVLYKPLPTTSIGATYRSKVKASLSGDTTVSIPNIGDTKFDASLDVSLPEIWDISVSQQLSSAWTLHATVKHTAWSVFDELRIENKGGPSSVEPERWHDTFAYALGISYALNDAWLLRAGIVKDQSPVPASTRSVRLPANDQTIYGIGAHWNYSAAFSYDFMYSYTIQKTAKVDVSNGSEYYRADYNTRIPNFRAQINWRF